MKKPSRNQCFKAVFRLYTNRVRDHLFLPISLAQIPRLEKFCMVLVFILCFLYLCEMGFIYENCNVRKVHADRMQLAQGFAKQVIQAKCRPSFAKTEMSRMFNAKYNKELTSFLKKTQDFNKSLYTYGPPFGFHKYFDQVDNILELLPEHDLPKVLQSKDCKRCIVLGNGGILHGLQLGNAINQYDVVIRLNNAPVQGYVQDVGEKTTIRMTYPEGAPVSEKEYSHNSLFVTVLFKHADIEWLHAILTNETLSLWNRLFFWKNVPERLPLTLNQFRILNPLIVKETALDILQYPEPNTKWIGWEKNVPTIGVTAVVLATHLCDEVSLAGFGYDLSQLDTPLHYYDNHCMRAMKRQPMHDIIKEKKFLQTLVKEDIVKDLSGGIHCAFCDPIQQGI